MFALIFGVSIGASISGSFECHTLIVQQLPTHLFISVLMDWWRLE